MSLFNPCAADQPALWTLRLPPGHQGVEGGLGGPQEAHRPRHLRDQLDPQHPRTPRRLLRPNQGVPGQGEHPSPLHLHSSPYPLLSSSPSHQINFSPHHHLTSSPSNLTTFSPLASSPSHLPTRPPIMLSSKPTSGSTRRWPRPTAWWRTWSLRSTASGCSAAWWGIMPTLLTWWGSMSSPMPSQPSLATSPMARCDTWPGPSDH